MQTVDIHQDKKDVIKKFIEKVREKKIMSSEEVYDFFDKLVRLECENYNIEVDCKLINYDSDKNISEENVYSFDTIFSEFLANLKKETSFFVEPIYFFKRYFYSEEVENRLKGGIELLLLIYRELWYVINLKNIEVNYLSPETLKNSRMRLINKKMSKEFVDDNNFIFFDEKNALEYAYSNIFEMVQESDVLKIIKSEFFNKEYNDFIKNNIAKIKYNETLYKRDEWILEKCSELIGDSPKELYDFPILTKQYNLDGSLKNIYELFEEMGESLGKITHSRLTFDKNEFYLRKEYLDCRMFYYELILPQLSTASEEDYKKIAEKYGVSSLQYLLANMEKYFNNKVNKKLMCADGYCQEDLENSEEIENELKHSINSIIRFRNGAVFNNIAEKLLREGGFVRGTREILANNVLKRRELFANSLVGVYDAIESEEEYCRRAENEKANIDEVVNALYYNRFENCLNNIELKENGHSTIGKAEVIKIAQILKIVKILSNETKKNYFKEFLTIPDVNALMILLEKDNNGYLAECMKKSQIRIKKVVYPFTEAEEGKYRNYIFGNEDTEDSLNIKNKITMLNEEVDVKN